MDIEAIEKLLTRFDALDQAAQSVLTALPHQMTEAAAKLDAERLAMRTELQQAVIAATRKPDVKTLVNGKWVVWINFVRDAYAELHSITPREATGIIERFMLDQHNEAKMTGLFNSNTGHQEAARQIGRPK